MPFISSIRRNYDIERQQNRNFEVSGGDSVYVVGGYRVHTFTSVGAAEFFVKNLNQNCSNSIGLYDQSTLRVEALLVGGGGGVGSIGGGGGAGGVAYTNGLDLNAPVSVNVGGGGAPGGTYPGPKGSPGGNTTFKTYTALGGGASGSWNNNAPVAGGCGAGGPGTPGTGVAGGAAGQPGQAQPEGGYSVGFPGARGGTNPASNSYTGAGTYTGGGGGGAGAAGGSETWSSLNTADSPQAGRPGGNGITSSISGASQTYAGGGGGGAHTSGYNSPFTTALGGRGGGGTGASFDREFAPAGRGQAGFTNTGGGGGGGWYTGTGTGAGGPGGPGIVIVRYLI